MRVPMLEDTAAGLDRLYREGKLERARDPEEIKRNIELLKGKLRGRQLARERLIGAGEYAMPQLLQAFLQNQDLTLKARVQGVIIDMGRQAITPLTTSLPALDPERQEAVAEVLGLIPYRTSLPALTELAQNTGSQEVRAAANRSIQRLGGDPSADVAGLHATLAETYYEERAELTSFPGEDHQLLWNYDPGLGLLITPIRTPVYHEAMAMQESAKALELRAEDATLALWIASNYSREIDTPEGYENPAYGPDRRSAEYFGVGAGPSIAQVVLARALGDRDTPLAGRAIAAIEETAGRSLLVGGQAGASTPLVEALGYPNKRVQYEAALAIGRSQPTASFGGSQRVVPLLTSAVRDASSRYAVVLTGSDRESYDRYRALLEEWGFTVLPPADNGVDQLDGAIDETPGIDLVVADLSLDRTREQMERVRANPRLTATPALLLARPEHEAILRKQFDRDQTVMVRRGGIGEARLEAAVDELIEVAAGGVISESEAAGYAARALSVLRDLAVSGNDVLDVSDSASGLITVLGDVDGDVMLDVAEVLAHVPQARAQQALLDRVLEVEDERVDLLSKLADSAKRFGNLLDDRRVRRVSELSRDDDPDVATAAVAVFGALGLPNQNLLPMLLKGDQGEARVAGPRDR